MQYVSQEFSISSVSVFLLMFNYEKDFRDLGSGLNIISELMIPKILSRKFFITLIFLIICKAALSEDIDDHTIISSGTETNQQKFIKNNISLTIKDGATLSVSIKPAHINSKSGATVTVESGGKITGD